MNETRPMRILSLGAGVQSSTVLRMSIRGELPRLDAAVFSDTGWEPPAVYSHLDDLKREAEAAGITLSIVGAGNIRDDALRSKVRGLKGEGTRWVSMPYFTKGEDGRRGMIKRQCTKEYKLVPIQREMRRLAGYRPRQRIPAGTVEQWIGISIDEAQRMKDSRVAWIVNRFPLIYDIRKTRAECIVWNERNGYPPPPRSACIGCPFKHNAEWRETRARPEEWEDAVRFDEAIRSSGGERGGAYIHADRVPLKLAKIDDGDPNQGSLFGNECEGLCGV